ncbi:MAG: hypothetical protein IPI37_06615 [Bacteroidales bacterium]|jgi:hypothetical protein|nr:hypothetical protein [Bacteroidales bacterium]
MFCENLTIVAYFRPVSPAMVPAATTAHVVSYAFKSDDNSGVINKHKMVFFDYRFPGHQDALSLVTNR